MKDKVCVLQFERAGNFKECRKKAKNCLKQAHAFDFDLIGGEFSLSESKRIDPYPTLIELARSFNCNIVAPINANFRLFPKLREKGFFNAVFNRVKW